LYLTWRPMSRCYVTMIATAEVGAIKATADYEGVVDH
jgi:hypothetical protein